MLFLGDDRKEDGMRTVTLNVPFHEQPDKYTCGPACAKMILSFDRKRAAFDTLVAEIGARGTTLSRLGEAFLRRGYAAHIITAAPRHEVTKRFLKNGGTRARRRVTAHDLRTELSNRRPVILNVRTTTLWRTDDDPGDHVVAVTGFTEKSFRILDPYPRHGGPRLVSERHLMRACAVAGYAALFLRP